MSQLPGKGSWASYEDLVERSPDIIYLLDREGRFLYVNPAGPQILRLTEKETRGLIGSRFTDVLTPSSADFAWSHFRTGLEGGQASPFFEVEAQRGDGGRVTLEIHASNHYRDGELVAIQGVARDISAIERHQDEVSVRSERIAVMQERSRIARDLYNRISQLALGHVPDPNPDPEEVVPEFERALSHANAQKLGLSAVDLEILQLAASGATNRGIADEVHLSVHTVKDHLSALMHDLEAANRTDLAVRAAKLGLV